MTYYIFALFILVTMMAGCSHSSKTITDHFENLSQIAASYGNDCENMAKSLNQYLVQNEDSLKTAVSDVSQATPEEATSIYNASAKLHTSTEHCHTAELENFRKHLSDIVFLEAINQ